MCRRAPRAHALSCAPKRQSHRGSETDAFVCLWSNTRRLRTIGNVFTVALLRPHGFAVGLVQRGPGSARAAVGPARASDQDEPLRGRALLPCGNADLACISNLRAYPCASGLLRTPRAFPHARFPSQPDTFPPCCVVWGTPGASVRHVAAPLRRGPSSARPGFGAARAASVGHAGQLRAVEPALPETDLPEANLTATSPHWNSASVLRSVSATPQARGKPTAAQARTSVAASPKPDVERPLLPAAALECDAVFTSRCLSPDGFTRPRPGCLRRSACVRHVSRRPPSRRGSRRTPPRADRP